jgi:Ca2+-binding RTX toxin-like protein
MATPFAWGSVFSVNTTTKDHQSALKMHALKDGSFVAVWTDESRTGADTSGSAVRGQLFNADGSKKGSEFLVNTSPLGRQEEPVVTILNDGRFVVAWTDGGSGYVMARAYNANGSAIGGEFRVSSTGGDIYPAITALSNGGFAVSYYDDAGDTRVQSFGANLQKTGTEAVTDANSFDTKIVGLQGQYIVFSDEGATIKGQIFNNDGSKPAGSTLFSISTTGDDTNGAAATKLADGRIIVTWTSWTASSGSMQVKGQILNPNGTKSGGELLLSAAGLTASSVSSVTALADGGFAVAYLNHIADRNSTDVHVASFNGNGVRTSDDTIVERVYGQFYSTAITTLADGRVTVSWTNEVSVWDDNGSGLHGQILDLRQKGVAVNGSAADDRYYGSKFNDMIKGEAGNDMLFGHEGSDTLTGGAGSDAFVFDTAPVVGKAKHIDRIVDFDAKADKIYLDDAIFKGLSKKVGSLEAPVKIDKKAFWKGNAAHDKNDRIIVKMNGEVLFDVDGVGKQKAVVVAKLDAKTLKFLDYADFLLI